MDTTTSTPTPPNVTGVTMTAIQRRIWLWQRLVLAVIATIIGLILYSIVVRTRTQEAVGAIARTVSGMRSGDSQGACGSLVPDTTCETFVGDVARAMPWAIGAQLQWNGGVAPVRREGEFDLHFLATRDGVIHRLVARMRAVDGQWRIVRFVDDGIVEKKTEK